MDTLTADQRAYSYPPSVWETRRLWSLWDMLILDAKEFVRLLHALFDSELRTRGKTGPVANRAQAEDAAKNIIEMLRALDLPVSIKTAENMICGCTDYEKLHRGLEQLTANVALELEGRKFYGPVRRYEQYYEQPKLFGDDVFENLPSANNDIFEAGTCLALERGTACVMHLMRVVEAGLKVLAAEIGVNRRWIGTPDRHPKGTPSFCVSND